MGKFENMVRSRFRLRRVGLTAQLGLIVAAVCIPLIVVGLWDASRESARGEADAFGHAATSSQLAGGRIEERVRAVKVLERLVASRVGNSLANPGSVAKLLAELESSLAADVGRLQVVDLRGKVVASLRLRPARFRTIDYADAPWFMAAIRTATAQVSGLERAQGTGAPEMVLAFPVTLPGGAVIGVIVASLDLAILSAELAADLPTQRLVIISDNENNMVRRDPAADPEVAARVVGGANGSAVSFSNTKALDAQGWLGDSAAHRFAVATTRIAGTPWQIAVGIPQQEVLGASRNRAARSLVITLVVSALAGLLAYLSARSMVRPLIALRDGLRRVAAGEAGVRIVASGSGEVRQLARDFNRMTEQADLDRRDLTTSEARYRSLVALSADWQWETDAGHRVRFMSEVTHGPDYLALGSVLGHCRWEARGADPQAACWGAHKADLEARRPFRDFEYARTGASGAVRWISINGEPQFDAAGTFSGYRGTGRWITERVRAAQRLELLAEGVPGMVAYLDPEFRIRYANRAYAGFFAGPDAQVDGRTVAEVIGEASWAQVASRFAAAAAGEDQFYDARRRGADNEWHDLEITLRPHQDAGRAVVGLYIFLQDVTARRRSSAQLQLRNRALDASVSSVMITGRAVSGLRIEYVNAAFERVTGYSAAEVLGRNPRFMHRGFEEQSALAALRLAVQEARPGTALLRNVRKNGTPFWNEVHIAPVRDAEGEVTHFIGASEDVSARVEYQQELERQANFDALTGLPNRNLLQDRLAQAIAQSARLGTMAAVLYVDVDHFKRVNDSVGHRLGDEVLRIVSARIGDAVRGGDTVARLGGDEFVVVMSDVKHEADAMRVAQKLREAVAAPVQFEAHEFVFSASVGIALTAKDGTKDGTKEGTKDGTTAETLMQHADTALYRAKEEGRDCAWFFTADLNDHALRFIGMETALRNALAQQAFELHYQPIVRLRDGSWVGAEALIRLRRGDGSLVPPAEFIPVAEDSGLIVPIGRWVIETAVRQALAWQTAGLEPFVIAINLSARQFRDPGLVELVRDAIAAAGLPAAAIKLEITESTVMRNAREAAATLRQLQALGVRLSIDDFGTGYSSLAYLKTFPISTLKLDRSFVSGLPDDADDLAISHGIINLAHGLKLDVVAEGIETFAQAEKLDALDCEYAQGYLFGRPVAPAQFERLRVAAVRERATPAT